MGIGSVGAGARTSMSRLLLHWGMLFAALAFTGWWATRTVLDTHRTREVAHVVLADASFRSYVAGAVATAAAQVDPGIGQLASGSPAPGAPSTAPIPGAPGGAPSGTSDALESRISTVIGAPAIRDALEQFVTDVHRRLIGETDKPAVLDPGTTRLLVASAVPTATPSELDRIPAVTFDIPAETPLRTLHTTVGQRLPWFIGAALLLLGASLLLTADRRSALRTIGWWLVGISAAHLVVMWLLPIVVVPRFVSGPWPPLIAAVARALGSGIVVVLGALAAAGVVILLADRLAGRPRGRSTDVPAPPPPSPPG